MLLIKLKNFKNTNRFTKLTKPLHLFGFSKNNKTLNQYFLLKKKNIILNFYFNKKNNKIKVINSGAEVVSDHIYGLNVWMYWNYNIGSKYKVFKPYNLFKKYLFLLNRFTLINKIVCLFTNMPLYSASHGLYCILLKLDRLKNTLCVQLPSGYKKNYNYFVVGTVGRNLNIFHKYQFLGKISNKKGTTPSVRGVAMNPVDHHNGGRTSKKTCFLNKYGKVALYSKNMFKSLFQAYIIQFSQKTPYYPRSIQTHINLFDINRVLVVNRGNYNINRFVFFFHISKNVRLLNIRCSITQHKNNIKKLKINCLEII